MTRAVVRADLWIVGDEDEADGFRFELLSPHARWMANDNWIRIDEVRASFELPGDLTEETIRLRAITTLKEKQERILADAQARVNRDQKEIDKLLALPAPASSVAVVADFEGDVVDASFEEVTETDELPF